MKKSFIIKLILGASLLFMFLIWTALILTVNVNRIGETETLVGFSDLNLWVHSVTGVNMWLYGFTDIVTCCVT